MLLKRFISIKKPVLVGFLFFLSFIGPACQAIASSLVFQGQNAGLFPTANPNDTSILMNSVPKKNATVSSASTAQSYAQQNMTLLLQNAIIASLSSSIVNAIKDATPTPQTVNLGNDNTITYQLDELNKLIIIDIINQSGATRISVPSDIWK
jgi:hypothetical protein